MAETIFKTYFLSPSNNDILVELSIRPPQDYKAKSTLKFDGQVIKKEGNFTYAPGSEELINGKSLKIYSTVWDTDKYSNNAFLDITVRGGEKEETYNLDGESDVNGGVINFFVEIAFKKLN